MVPVVLGVLLWLQGCSSGVDELTAEKEKNEEQAEERKEAEAAAKACEPATNAANAEMSGDCVIFPSEEHLKSTDAKQQVIAKQAQLRFRCVDCTGACKDAYQVQELSLEPRWQGEDAGTYPDPATLEAGGSWEHGSLQDCHGEAHKDNDGQDRMCGGFVVAMFKATDGQKDGQKFCSEAMVTKALEDSRSGLSYIQTMRGGGTDKTDKKDRYDAAVEAALEFHWDKAKFLANQKENSETAVIELQSDSGSRAEETRPARPLVATQKSRPGEEWVVSAAGATKRGPQPALVED